MPGLFHPLVGDQVINARQEIEYVSSTKTYYGLAAPGTATDQAGWQIREETLDTQGRTTSIKFASRTVEYNLVWADRATYTYS